MSEQVDSTDCIHCDGTAVRATDFKSGTVLEHYRCLACGKKFSPDEATGPVKPALLDEAKPEPKKTGSKRPSLSPAHKEKPRKSRIETVAKRPKRQERCVLEVLESTCTKPRCTNPKVPGRAWCQKHVDQHKQYQKPKTTKAANVVVGELPPQPETVTKMSRASVGGVIKPAPWQPIEPETTDWKAEVLAQLDAERMGMYKRLDKLVAAIDAIKAL